MKGNDEVKAMYGSAPFILQTPTTPDPAVGLPLLYLNSSAARRKSYSNVGAACSNHPSHAANVARPLGEPRLSIRVETRRVGASRRAWHAVRLCV